MIDRIIKFLQVIYHDLKTGSLNFFEIIYSFANQPYKKEPVNVF